MSDRYTKKDAERVTRRLAEVLSLPYGHYKKEGDSYRPQLNALVMDYNPTYGGCVIEQITNEDGGVGQPFGAQRRSPREFVHFVNAILLGIFIEADNRVQGAKVKL